MNAPIVRSFASILDGNGYSGLEKQHSVMFTSAKATNRFFERSVEQLSRNFVFSMIAFDSLNETVFLMAVLFWNQHLLILFGKYEEDPNTSMQDERFAKFDMKDESIILKRD